MKYKNMEVIIMKKISKIIALLCACLLIASAFAGCGGNKVERVETDGSTFTYWCTMNSTTSRTLSDYSEMLFYQEMEKATGVHIDFTHPIEGSTGNEAFIAMLSGSDLPDMMEYNWANYSGGPQQALDDEVVIELNDYLEEHAPSYYNYMEGEYGKEHNYAYKLAATTDDGRYYGFNVLNLGETRGFAGLYVRADLLKKWNMEIPETIDEWTAVFAKAKSEGFSRPFTCNIGVLSFRNATINSFNTAYDVGK
ncbi:MAG: extracellular solute-binding protein, partial [Ruminococcaceae bacterium]|nr:extracellular solute-binding protein [Oscillospiraceae bacterium]